MKEEQTIFVFAFFFGMTAVILGAFGAHFLEGKLTPEMLEAYDTGVRYQFYHSFLLLFCGLYYRFKRKRFLLIACGLAIIGILLFSGSLYIISTQAISGLNGRYLGPVTPVGGLFLISSWMVLLIAYIDLLVKKKRHD